MTANTMLLNNDPFTNVPSAAVGLSAGERDAKFADVLEECSGDLRRFTAWLCRDRSVAEDVLQQTLLRAWRARGSLRDTVAIRAWLFAIARREYARLHERKQLRLVNIDRCEAEGESGLIVEEEDLRIRDLRAAVASLADEYRLPLVLQVLAGYTVAEIGEALRLSVPAVLSRLYRARNQLRTLCGQ
jgi:RNA polymerase sigma-70 factor, ECF subfamily